MIDGVLSIAIFICTSLCISESGADLATSPDIKSQNNITTTSRIDNYILTNQRQYFSNSRSLVEALEQFKKNYDDRVRLLLLNRQFLQFKLLEMEQKLNPMELLDDLHNICVHKHRTKLPDAKSINISLDMCKQKALGSYTSLVEEPFQTLRKLENYYKNETVAALKYCKVTIGELHKNYTQCVTSVVQQCNEVSAANINAFHNLLKKSESNAEVKMKETFDCYAFVIFHTLNSLGVVDGMINSCIAGVESCPNCSDLEQISAERCPYHMNMPLTEDFRFKEKVSNPFKGLTQGTPCLQINFINVTVPYIKV